MAEGLGDVTRVPALIAELLARGYTDEEAKKVAGGNLMRLMRLMRVMREAERVSEELRKERDPSIADSRRLPPTPGRYARAEGRESRGEIPLTSPFFLRTIISISFN